MPLEFKVLEPRNPPRQLIVILHGIGSNKERMTEFGQYMADTLPDSVILIPQGPLQYQLPADVVEKAKQDGVDPNNCHSWFELDLVKMPLRLIFNRLSIISELNTLIDEQLQKYGLSDQDLCLWGFSQGGGLAVYTAIKRKEPCAAVVCHSSPFIGFSSAKSHPQTLMIMGEKDIAQFAQAPLPVKILFSFERSIERLKRRNIPVTSAVIPALGHGTNEATIALSTDFFRKNLRRP